MAILISMEPISHGFTFHAWLSYNFGQFVYGVGALRRTLQIQIILGEPPHLSFYRCVQKIKSHISN